MLFYYTMWLEVIFNIYYNGSVRVVKVTSRHVLVLVVQFLRRFQVTLAVQLFGGLYQVGRWSKNGLKCVHQGDILTF